MNSSAESLSLLQARIGELIFLGDASTGCSGDNQQVYDIAKKMVTRWAMSDSGSDMRW